MPFKFEHVPGFFHTDVLAPAISAEEALGQSFGLLDTSPERWEKLKARLERESIKRESTSASRPAEKLTQIELILPQSSTRKV